MQTYGANDCKSMPSHAIFHGGVCSYKHIIHITPHGLLAEEPPAYCITALLPATLSYIAKCAYPTPAHLWPATKAPREAHWTAVLAVQPSAAAQDLSVPFRAGWW